MIEIIPAIDLIEGKCVRLAEGDFARRTTYRENPLEVAREFENAGLRRLHVVDLDGARTGKIVNLKTLEAIAAGTSLTIDFGGGIKTESDLQSVFDAGAALAAIGSIAVREPELFFSMLDRFGGDRLLLGADAKNEKLAINGWQTSTEIELIPFLREYAARGVRQVFVTDIGRDGLLQGAAGELYERILREIPDLRLIASGGVSTLEDIRQLEEIGCAGVIVGKALYEGKIKLEELVTDK